MFKKTGIHKCDGSGCDIIQLDTKLEIQIFDYLNYIFDQSNCYRF